MTGPKKRQPVRRIKHKSWGDLRKDRDQQRIYKENIGFLAGLYLKYGDK